MSFWSWVEFCKWANRSNFGRYILNLSMNIVRSCARSKNTMSTSIPLPIFRILPLLQIWKMRRLYHLIWRRLPLRVFDILILFLLGNHYLLVWIPSQCLYILVLFKNIGYSLWLDLNNVLFILLLNLHPFLSFIWRDFIIVLIYLVYSLL